MVEQPRRLIPRIITFEQARAIYVHRYTMDHVPEWARSIRSDGTYYAPHYRSDAEWYDNTEFPGEGFISPRATHCHSRNQSWPLGKALDKPYTIGMKP